MAPAALPWLPGAGEPGPADSGPGTGHSRTAPGTERSPATDRRRAPDPREDRVPVATIPRMATAAAAPVPQTPGEPTIDVPRRSPRFLRGLWACGDPATRNARLVLLAVLVVTVLLAQR
jgi:hypothetical protein